MEIPVARFTRRALVAALTSALAACQTGGGHDPVTPPPSDCELAPAIPASQPFTVSGNAVYDFVPAAYDPVLDRGTLQFGATEQRPVREADVEVRQCGNVLASTTTDAAGHYAVTFVPAAQGQVSVNVLARTADHAVQIVDNTAGGAIWAVAQPIASATPTLDVHATSGWTGAGYGAGRIAAPFAILDDLYTAEHRLLDLPRDVAFASVPLTVNWSPLNTPDPSCAGGPSTGCIGTSYYDPSVRQIFVLGAAGIDTDEFDREVIVHEWGHYFEDNFSASDSPGGPHGFGDVLDPRLSFGEGYASAFAAMLLQQTIYADTYWTYSGLSAFGWDVESRPSPTDDPRPGPFSELSIIRAMWDLYDSGTNEAGYDNVALGLGPIYDTLVGPERTTPALTTIASFIAGLKETLGNDATANAGIDAVLGFYGIGPITSAFGAGDAQLASMYTPITSFPSSATVTLDATFFPNEQPQNRYFYFTAPSTHVTVSTSCAYDVDLYAYQAGKLLDARESTSGFETIPLVTIPGETYVFVVMGWGGYTNPVPAPGTYPVTVSFASP